MSASVAASVSSAAHHRRAREPFGLELTWLLRHRARSRSVGVVLIVAIGVVSSPCAQRRQHQRESTTTAASPNSASATGARRDWSHGCESMRLGRRTRRIVVGEFDLRSGAASGARPMNADRALTLFIDW
jgi:hypothetical protein